MGLSDGEEILELGCGWGSLTLWMAARFKNSRITAVSNSRNHQQTSEAWLDNMDAARAEILPILARTYGEDQALKWWVYWRVFFMACAEAWGFRGGRG